MRRVTVLATVLAVTLPGVGAQAAERSWHCEDQMDLDREEVAARAPNLGIQRILEEYRQRWDAQHIRQQCEAFATGEPYEIGCLNDRRDWDAIEAMVPDEFFGMSNSELRPHYLELQTADDGYAAAVDYCRSVGAVE